MISGDLVAVHYPPGAGGKFLQNVMGLSRHCVLKHPEWAAWDCEQTEFDAAYYQQKFAWARSTIPVKPSADWMSYELSDGAFYGDIKSISEIARTVAAAGRWSTVSIHVYARRILNYERTHIVNLTPAEQFAAKWFRIKNVNAPAKMDQQQPNIPEYIEQFCFDIDNTIYKTARFVAQCRQMYAYFGWDDFKPGLVSELHQIYMAWHHAYENAVNK